MTLRDLFAPLGAMALLALAAPSHAEEPIETDRPDFVESSAVVGAGRWQLETGFTSDRTTSGGTTTRTLATPTLVRVGLGDTLELRAEGNGFTRERVDDTTTGTRQRSTGFSDISLGLKWHMQDGEGTRPGVAWLLHVDTPSGSTAFRGQGLRPSLRAAVEWDLPGDFSLGMMPGVFIDRTDAGRRFAGGIFAMTFGKAWTPRWHSFVEVAGQRLAARRDGGSTVTLDTGLAFLATDDVQLDVELAHGLSDAAPDLEAGAGISIRF